MEYIISKHNGNGRLYAYYKGDVWFWDTCKGAWFISPFAVQEYRKAQEEQPELTLEQFIMGDTGDFEPLDDWEVDAAVLNALQNANKSLSEEDEPTQPLFSSAVATAAEDQTAESTEALGLDSTMAAPAASDSEQPENAIESTLAEPDGLTAFDYTGLDAQTAEHLQNLAQRALAAKQRYVLDLMEIVAEAHRELVALCDKQNNQHSDNTFRTWCASIGVSKDTAYRLLQVQTLMDSSTAAEQEVLADAPAKLLYAAAKPSAPTELVQAVKDGDITTHKQYQEALAKLKATEQELAQAKQEAALDRKERENANAAALRYKAECDRRAQEQQRVEGLLATQQEKTRQAERRAEAAEKEAQEWQDVGTEMQEIVEQRDERIRELESGQTIEVTAIDQTELDRRVKEAVQAENAKWEQLCQNQQETINTLKREGSVAAQVKSITSAVENLLDGLLFTVQNEEVSAENCAAVDGLLDTLQKYYNHFYDAIDGEEGDEDGEE